MAFESAVYLHPAWKVDLAKRHALDPFLGALDTEIVSSYLPVCPWSLQLAAC